MNRQATDRADAIEQLHKLVTPGATLYTVLRSVSRSGMSRNIDVYAMTVENGALVKRWLSPLIARATGITFDRKRESLKMGGCGMDMGFAIVYDVGRTLYPKGFPVVERCDKCLDRPGKNGLGAPCKTCTGTGMKPKRGRNGDESGWDTDGGYALRHEWI